MEDSGITLGLMEGIFRPLIQGSAVGLSLITVVLSNLVSNMPAVLLLERVVRRRSDPVLHLGMASRPPPLARQVPAECYDRISNTWREHDRSDD